MELVLELCIVVWSLFCMLQDDAIISLICMSGLIIMFFLTNQEVRKMECSKHLEDNLLLTKEQRKEYDEMMERIIEKRKQDALEICEEVK